MGFVTFGLEQWQSEHEQEVAYALTDSGVQPVTWREPVRLGLDLEALLDLPLRYPEVNGTRALRERIAALHPGATATRPPMPKSRPSVGEWSIVQAVSF